MARDRDQFIKAARLPNSDKYLVIGGYGVVGRVVCQHLGTKFPGRVIAAGRNIEAASAFVSSLSGRVSSRALDVRDPVMLDDAVKDACVVITCVEVRNREIAEACVRQGANFVDISASYPVLQSLEALNDRARASGVTGVLSVGLAPGSRTCWSAKFKMSSVRSARPTSRCCSALATRMAWTQSAGRWRTAAPWARRSAFSFLSHTARERPMGSISPTSTSFGTPWR